MVILFFVALILAWPTAGLSIVAYIVLIVAKGFFQGKERMHHADKLRAQREVSTNGARLPSWMANKDKIEVFIYTVQNVAKHNGVPKSFVESTLSDQEIARSVFQYAGAMEAQGASFIDQQRAVVEMLVEMYEIKDVVQTNKYVANGLSILSETLSGNNVSPSWAEDGEALNQFFKTIKKSAVEQDVSESYIDEYLADDVTGPSILHYMRVLERQGKTHMEQRIAAIDCLKRDWIRLSRDEQSRYTDNDIPF